MKKRMMPFTALELVLVCGVIAILLSISLPAFFNISEGRRLTAAATSIAANVSLARAKAVSDRRYIALIFPSLLDSDLLAALPKTDTSIYNTSVRLAEVRKKTDSSFDSFVFSKWLEGSSWESIGDGIIIPGESGSGSDDNFKVVNGDSAGEKYSVENVDFYDFIQSSTESANKKNVSRVIIFSPRGQILTKDAVTDTIKITLAEGVVSPIYLVKNDKRKVVTVNPISGRTSIIKE